MERVSCERRVDSVGGEAGYEEAGYEEDATDEVGEEGVNDRS